MGAGAGRARRKKRKFVHPRADRLEERGDSGLALRVAELGLVRYPNSAALLSSRTRSLTTQREINSQMNPFRFIIYSEWSGKSLAPVSPR